VQLIAPKDGLLTHANHFRGGGRVRDLAPAVAPSSAARDRRVDELVRGSVGAVAPGDLRAALADHADFPASVCYHEDPSVDPADRSVTAASIVMDLDRRAMSVAAGNPCSSPYAVLDLGASLAEVGEE